MQPKKEHAEAIIANIFVATTNFPSTLLYAGMKVSHTRRNPFRLKLMNLHSFVFVEGF